MHIIAIGWLWVAFMMAITQKTIVSGVSTFVFYGLLPCALLIYLLTTPARRKRRAQLETAEAAKAAEAAAAQAAESITPKAPPRSQ